MIEVFHSLENWRDLRKKISGTIGFVPTMGSLHQGHLSLIERARKENDIVVLSIYINPTQFDQKEDLQKYPQTWDDDLKLAQSSNVDFILAPKYQEIYPDSYRYQVHENELSQKLCGAHRPGHFNGVLTVVLKLLNLVKAHRAYFGEKDFQQYELIRDMCESFFIDTEIVPCPIIREASGLALSSRNQRLTEAEKKLAAKIYQTLTSVSSTEEAKKLLSIHPFEVDYIEDINQRRLAAVWIGESSQRVRLIDNVPL